MSFVVENKRDVVLLRGPLREEMIDLIGEIAHSALALPKTKQKAKRIYSEMLPIFEEE